VVTVDLTTLHVSRNGKIGGKVLLQLGNLFFPDPDWADFPVVLLTQWLRGTLSLVEGRQAEITNEFLDGPFRAILSVTSQSEWVVTLVEDRLQGCREVDRGAFDPLLFLRSLAVCSESVLKECDINRWNSSQVEELRIQLEAWRHINIDYSLKHRST
jgi:hypothetical protein